MPNKPTCTTLGTPCARSWTNDWIATVDAKEHELNHRICGARLPDATPCCSTSDHPSGRCPFHGGFDLTGAPPGNRNHVIHGMYSRRLRPCTQDCPHWQSCPIANTQAHHLNRHPRENGDPSSPSNPQSEIRNPQLEPPHSEIRNPQSEGPSPDSSSYRSHTSYRSYPPNAKPPQSPPTCVYQQIEYNTVLTDALAIVESQPHPNPMGIHAAHNVATLQVLVSNAAAQLTQASSLFEVPRASSPCSSSPQGARASSPCSSSPQGAWASSPCSSDDAFATLNPNAILAFTRLMREFRHSLKLLHTPGYTPLNRQNSAIQGSQSALPMSPCPEGILRHAERIQHDTGLDPDSLADAQLPPQTPETHAKAYIQRAALAGGQSRDVEMCEAFDNAALLDEDYAESERSHILASYRPARHSVSEELAEAILGHLHLEPPTTNGKGQPMRDEHTPDATASGTGQPTNEEPTAILQYYLDLIREGKMPPEGFPIGSPLRAHAETINASPPTTASKSTTEAKSE